MIVFISLMPPRFQHSHAQALGQQAPPARPETSSAKSLMDIGTRRIFNEDHDLFRESARRFFLEEVVPHHKEWGKTFKEPKPELGHMYDTYNDMTDIRRSVFSSLQVGESGPSQQRGVGESRWARPPGSYDTRGARWHRCRPVFCCRHVGRAVSISSQTRSSSYIWPFLTRFCLLQNVFQLLRPRFLLTLWDRHALHRQLRQQRADRSLHP